MPRRLLPALFASALFGVFTTGFAASAGAVPLVRIDEIAWGCRSGDLTSAFLELTATGPGQVRDAGLMLEVRNALGSTTSDAPIDFGTHGGEDWPEGTTWLLGAKNFASRAGFSADGRLPVSLDRANGSVVLYTLDDNGDRVVIDQFVWGVAPGLPRAPYLGQSLQRVDAATFTKQVAPTPTTSVGATGGSGCFGYVPSVDYRIDEAGFACQSGFRGVRFIELVSLNAAPLDPNVALRIESWSGSTLATFPSVFGTSGAAAGAGARYLLGSTGFASATALAVDKTLATLPDSLGGILTLYLPNPVGDSTTTIHVLRYGLSGGPPVPPGGSSLERQPDDSFAAQPLPSPTNLAGVTSSGACWGAAQAAIVINEVGLVCQSTGLSTSFVELHSTADGVAFTAGTGIRYFNHLGALILNKPGLFGTRVGDAFPRGYSFLLGTSAMAGQSGVTMDANLAFELDRLGGRIELYSADPSTGAVRVFDSLSYGSGGTVAAPAPGSVMLRSTDGTFQISTNATPTNFAGQYAAGLCFGDLRAPYLVISEVGLGCYYGEPGAAFIELEFPQGTRPLDSQTGLRMLDSHGTPLAEVPSILAAHVGESFARGSHFLMGSPGFAAALGSSPDLVLPLPPDSSGGTIAIFWRDPDTGRDTTLSELVYGTTAVRLPPPGGSLERVAGSGFYRILYSPTPTDIAGLTRQSTCFGYSPSVSSRIDEIGGECVQGSNGVRFIRLLTTGPQVLDPAIGLRYFAEGGSLLADIPAVFGSHQGEHVAASRSFLLGTPAFTAATGLEADGPLNTLPDASHGSVELYSRDFLTGNVVVFSRLAYGGGTVPLLVPGSSVRWNGSAYQTDLAPRPTNFADSSAGGPCYGIVDSLAHVRIQEYSFGCGYGPRDGAGAFVELVNEGPAGVVPSHLFLCALAGPGIDVFAGHEGEPWPIGSTWLVAGPAFAGENDALIPDTKAPVLALLPNLTLQFGDPAGGAGFILQRFNDATAWYGQSRQIDAHGVSLLAAIPTPRNRAGEERDGTNCLGRVATTRPTQIHQYSPGCLSGDPASRYVLIGPVSGGFPSNLRVKVENSTGQVLSDSPVQTNSGSRASLTGYWIAGNIGFAGETGFPPDAEVPLPVDTAGTRVILVRSGSSGGPDTLLWAFRFGSAFDHPSPLAGTMLAGDSVSYGPAPQEDPISSTVDYSTNSWTKRWSCFGNQTQRNMSMAQTLMQCDHSDSLLRFVTLNMPVFCVSDCICKVPPAVRVRTLGAGGTPLDSVDYVLGDRKSPLFLTSGFGGLLFSSTSLQVKTGVSPVARAPRMSINAGEIQVVMIDSKHRPLAVVWRVPYGSPGASNSPAPGLMIDGYGNLGAATVSDLAANYVPITGCTGCTTLGVRLGIGLATSEPPMSRFSRGSVDTTFSVIGTGGVLKTQRVRYDGTQGLLSLNLTQADNGYGQAVLDSRFTLHGPAQGTPIPIRVRVTITGHLTAPPDTGSSKGLIAARLTGDALTTSEAWQTWSDSAGFSVDRVISETLEIPLVVRPDVLFGVGIELKSARGAFPFAADLAAQLSFDDVPAGGVVTNCHGFGGISVAGILGSATAQILSDRVELQWTGGDAATSYSVERRDGDGPWTSLSRVAADQSGVIRVADSAIEGGHRYGYRLALQGLAVTTESWVEIPVRAVFALSRISPQPVSGDLAVRFSLPYSAPGRLVLYDIAGRMVQIRDLGSLGAGEHLVTLAPRGAVAPGIYLVRLTQGRNTRTERAVVIR